MYMPASDQCQVHSESVEKKWVVWRCNGNCTLRERTRGTHSTQAGSPRAGKSAGGRIVRPFDQLGAAKAVGNIPSARPPHSRNCRSLVFISKTVKF
jgi:hypothetical protein